ncbi:MAG TPA: hydantoinase/oxoprolinase family protein [Magnetospirillaceae bacterium]|jgi:N-methylhydantoinase A
MRQTATKRQATYRAGIDVGGTFTDVVIVDSSGTGLRILKTPSTRNQADGIVTGISAGSDDLGAFADISHGTTVATNILLEGNGASVGIVTTRGFRDTLEIGRCRRLIPGSIFNLKFVRPAPLAPRPFRFEIDERMGADGQVIEPLDTEGLGKLAAAIRAQGVQAIAVCFINSYLNSAHELQAKSVLEQALPDVFVCCSSEIVPQIREYERFSTASVNCYVAPVMARYMGSLAERLRSSGFRGNVLTMASSGGLLSADTVTAQPVRTILSGPAAAVNGAIYIGGLAGRNRLITYDMGGTSTDVCLIDRGEALIAGDTVVAGIPVSIPQVDIHSVGTGGGSIAWVNADASPQVGPRSAGADPGPISYGKGGTEITVTDANLLLGRLPERILDGAMTLAAGPVTAAFDKLAAQIKFSGRREDLAEGILRLAVVSMAGSVRKISIERGYDPRDFSIFAIGGAGPMHAAMVAEELEMREVIVPPMPGNISAFGHLVGNLRYDAMQSFHAPLTAFRALGGPRKFEVLARETRAKFEADGIAGRAIRVGYYADLRYAGQSYELTVPVTRPFAAERIAKDFTDLYKRRYGHDHKEAIEFTGLRVVCNVGRQVNIPLSADTGDAVAAAHGGRVYFGGRWHKAKVIRRARLPKRERLQGPVIIEEYGATTVVPPGWRVHVGAGGCLFLSRHTETKNARRR